MTATDLPQGQELQRGRDLIRFFHSRAQRPPTDEHQNVSRLDTPTLWMRALDSGDSTLFGREDFSRATFR
jgi:hypothetical protein